MVQETVSPFTVLDLSSFHCSCNLIIRNDSLAHNKHLNEDDAKVNFCENHSRGKRYLPHGMSCDILLPDHME